METEGAAACFSTTAAGGEFGRERKREKEREREKRDGARAGGGAHA